MTGPIRGDHRIPVTVLQCRTHRRAFTMYPLGHIPYGRLAITPVGLDGELVRSTESEPLVGGKRQPVYPQLAIPDPPPDRETLAAHRLMVGVCTSNTGSPGIAVTLPPVARS